MTTNLTRDNLYYRHQLSHEQIDRWLGEDKSSLYPESKAQHLEKIFEFEAVIKLFTDHGVSFLALKGPLLSYRLYGDPLFRSFNDLDFLVEPADVVRAMKLLEERGYTSPFYKMPADECRRKLLFRHMNEIFLYYPESDAGLEIHWKLFTGEFIGRKKLQHIISGNLGRYLYQDINLGIFSVEFELIYLIIHGGLHSWNKLKWLVDIKEMISQFNIDEKRFLELTHQMRAGRQAAVCNELLKTYFPESRLLPCVVKAPDHLVRFSLEQINQPVDEMKKSIRSYLYGFMHNIRAFPGIRYKISVLQHIFFATDLASKSWIPCSSVLYYLISPFWKLIRGFR